MASSKKNSMPINNKIRAENVLLIDDKGAKKGLVTFSEALEAAQNASLDLVQVSPSDADPVVCKLLDYGKHLFDKKKNASASKIKVKKNTTKEIKFRPSTDVGDYNIKLKKIKSFILDGDKTKISVRFRGREILNSDMGLNLLNKLRDELNDIAQVDQVETNIVIFTLPTPTSSEVVEAFSRMGIACFAFGPDKVRLVTHLDMTKDDIEEACRRIAKWRA